MAEAIANGEAPPPDDAPEPEPDPALNKFNVGDKVQVFSRTLSAWLPGEVLELDGEEVKVSYTDGAKKGTKYVEAADEETIRILTVTDAEALESAVAARIAQEKEVKAQVAAEEAEEAAAEAAMLAQGKSAPAIATKVQVYSRSQGQWLPGIVIAVEGIEAKVNYKSKGQIGEKWVYWAVRRHSLLVQFRPSFVHRFAQTHHIACKRTGTK